MAERKQEMEICTHAVVRQDSYATKLVEDAVFLQSASVQANVKVWF